MSLAYRWMDRPHRPQRPPPKNAALDGARAGTAARSAQGGPGEAGLPRVHTPSGVRGAASVWSPARPIKRRAGPRGPAGARRAGRPRGPGKKLVRERRVGRRARAVGPRDGTRVRGVATSGCQIRRLWRRGRAPRIRACASASARETRRRQDGARAGRAARSARGGLGEAGLPQAARSEGGGGGAAEPPPPPTHKFTELASDACARKIPDVS